MQFAGQALVDPGFLFSIFVILSLKIRETHGLMLTNRRPLENNEPGFFLRRIDLRRAFNPFAARETGKDGGKARRNDSSLIGTGKFEHDSSRG